MYPGAFKFVSGMTVQTYQQKCMRIRRWFTVLVLCQIYPTLVKVKESRNRPDVAQRVPGGLGPQIS